MTRPGWRKRAAARPPSASESAAAGLLLLFLSRAGISIPPGILRPDALPQPGPPAPRRVRDLGAAEVVE